MIHSPHCGQLFFLKVIKLARVAVWVCRDMNTLPKVSSCTTPSTEVILNLNVWQGRDAQIVFASCCEKIPCCVAVKYRTARGFFKISFCGTQARI
jgi:hypothetical protein